MPRLYEKCQNELKHPSKIVSYMFTWPSDANDQVTAIELNSGNYLYVYAKNQSEKGSS